MIPYKKIPSKLSKNLIGILTDIDDTLTDNGKLESEAYCALWDAYNAGLKVIPITGRPAGWCDMIARFWPVTGVIGENGAFYFYMKDGKIKRHFFDDEKIRSLKNRKLLKIKKEILRKFPKVKIAADQKYRESDLAIDFAEEVSDLNLNDALKIKKLFEENGAAAKISSIHVNGWFGDYNKLSGIKHFVKNVLKIDLNKNNDKFIFFGDSPNDTPMFKFFKLSVGVSNIKKYLDIMDCFPTYISDKKGGRGVKEVINLILKQRGR